MPRPTCDRVAGADHHVQGTLGGYLAAVTDQWLAVAPDANPGMLEILRDRDRRPYRDMVPWAGGSRTSYCLFRVLGRVLGTGDP